MPIIDGTYIAELSAAAVVALTVIAVGLQNLLKNWKNTNTESSLLKMMHDELERMSQQNATLSQEIGKLQTELIKLSTELTALTIENRKLQSEVSSLNEEISRLHGIMIDTQLKDTP